MLSLTSADVVTINDFVNSSVLSTSPTFFLDNYVNSTDFNGTDVSTNKSNSVADFELNVYDSCHPYSSNFNCSVADFLVYARGSKQMPLDTAILVSI